MAKRPKIELIARQPDPDVIEHLEKLLKVAKRGDIIGMAQVTVRPGGEARNGWCLMNWRHKDIMVAELVRLNTVLTLADPVFRSEVAGILEREMNPNG